MQNNSLLVPNNLSHAFCLSWLLQKCVSFQLGRFIAAWNEHPIPKSGIPAHALGTKKNYILPQGILPNTQEALALYQQTNNKATLTDPHAFVEDIVPEEMRSERNRKFEEIFGNLEEIANSMANSDYIPFQNSFSQMIQIQESFFIK